MNTQYSKLFVRIVSVSTIVLFALLPVGGALAKGPAIYTVNAANDSDDGACNSAHCSLREAINAANAHPGADLITFKLRGSAPFSIQPASALPEITEPVMIDATTQRGYAGQPVIELDGSNAGDETNGLVISGGSSLVKGLAINRFSGDAIILRMNGGNRIQGNFLGTDLTGTIALSNFRGVVIQEGSSGNLIGGAQALAGNLLSGNEGAGVRLSDPGTEGNLVQGNLLGTDITGMAPLGNNIGVRITNGAANNLIGGTGAGARNVISGNYDCGLCIDEEEGPGTTGNLVQGNYVGTDASGAAALPNGTGVWIAFGATNTLIGGAGEGAGNLISGNGGDGVFIGEPGTTGTVLQGNFIGTDASGTAALPNGADGVRILGGASNTLIGGGEHGARNLISGNAYIGVSLWDSGTSDNAIQGNYIGTDISGAAALPNGNGVWITSGATGTLVGGAGEGAGNLISGNVYEGVFISDPGTTGAVLQGNFIGTDASGAAALPNGTGVWISAGATNTLVGGVGEGAGNLISGNGSSGVYIADPGTEGNQVQGNLIGTDVSGTSPLGSPVGIWVTEGAADNLIGGTQDGARNVVSGNQYNVGLGGGAGTAGNTVQGNYIGTDLSGAAALANSGVGVLLFDNGSDNLVGGTEPGAGNLISGNSLWGVFIIGSGVTGNRVQGNLIGTDASGTQPVGNLAGGVIIANGAADNWIGGTEPGAGNTVAFNGNKGIALFSLAGSGNALLSNSIYSNDGLGIDLGNDGVTLNDALDQDSGPNGLQNYPVITGVTPKGASVMIHGSFASTPGATFRLEFFGSAACDPSGYGEGQAFLGFAYVTTNPEGVTVFNVPVTLPGGAFVTATATDPAGSTSEFSNCFSP